MAENFVSASDIRQEINSSSAKARETVKNLFDEGTFLEKGTYIKDGQGYLESVITGGGSVDLRPVFAFVQDAGNENGGFSASQAKKIVSVYDMALKCGAPIVAFFENSGAKASCGISVMSAYASVLKASNEAKGIIPQLAVVKGKLGGAEAVICAGFDFVIACEGAEYHVSANGKNDCGIFDIVCPENEIYNTVKKLLSFLPSSCDEINELSEGDSEINSLLPLESDLLEGDAHAVINAVSDSEPLYIKENTAKEILSAFAVINGRTVGILANNPAFNGGKITKAACEKAAKFIDTLSCFSIPLVSIVNSEGYGEDESGYAEAMFDMADAYVNSESAKITVFTGNSYGFAPQLLASKEMGADFVFALENAVIAMLPPKTAVEFLYENELKAASSPDFARESLKEEYIKNECSALNYAKNGDVDDIITLGELKMRIASALEFLN